jgi:uncharacterized membrane protein
MIIVTLYHKADCHLCEEVEEMLTDLQAESPHHLVKIDIEGDEVLKSQYAENIPVIAAGPYTLSAPFTRQDLQVALNATQEIKQARDGDSNTIRPVKLSAADRITEFFSNRYMLVFNLVVFIYVGLTFLAPALMKVGLPGPAKVIYTVYSPLCHQLGFRSFFIFGEQPFYPRRLASVPGVQSYEELISGDTISILEARRFIGDENLGYKVALCERDIAIYGAILLFGLLFAATGKRIKSLPWYIWILIGLVPIGLDGTSQLPSLGASIFPDWLPIRESTPFLRVLTGGLFGLTTAWYLYPYVEESMRDNHQILARKKAIAEQTADLDEAG